MMLFELSRFPRSQFFQESRQILALALPMMLAQIAAVGMGVIDTIMAGNISKADLTAVALGSAVFATVFITFMGIMAALNPMIAQAFGAGQKTEIGETVRQGIWFALGLGLSGTLLIIAALPIMQDYLKLGDTAERMLTEYLIYMALAMPAVMLYRVFHAYISSLQHPKAIMWISWLALLLNIPLNAIFMYGYFGLPAIGGAGAGLASMLVHWFSVWALAIYAIKNRRFADFQLTARFSRPNWSIQKQIWRLGWPIGLSYFLEASLFTSVVWLIADWGEDYVAAQQVVISLSSVIYMVPQAIGMAVTVRVGYSIGKRDGLHARYATGTGIAVSVILASIFSILLIVLRHILPTIYTDDVQVIHITASVILMLALGMIPDFVQAVASYALRGYKQTRAPMLIHAVSFWGLGLLPGYVIAHGANLGIYGFWIGIELALITAAIALLWYAEIFSKRTVQNGHIESQHHDNSH